MKLLFRLLAAIVLAVLSHVSMAQDARPAASPGAASSPALTDGEVRKVDRDQGKLTLRHGPLLNLDMPGMTMVFKVADPRMLDGLKEGDKVRFAAERLNGSIALTVIQSAN